MEEKLITEFMAFGKRFIYEDPVIENIQVAGEWVMFTESEKNGFHKEQHQITLLEIVAFVNWRIGNRN